MEIFEAKAYLYLIKALLRKTDVPQEVLEAVDMGIKAMDHNDCSKCKYKAAWDKCESVTEYLREGAKRYMSGDHGEEEDHEL